MMKNVKAILLLLVTLSTAAVCTSCDDDGWTTGGTYKPYAPKVKSTIEYPDGVTEKYKEDYTYDNKGRLVKTEHYYMAGYAWETLIDYDDIEKTKTIRDYYEDEYSSSLVEEVYYDNDYKYIKEKIYYTDGGSNEWSRVKYEYDDKWRLVNSKTYYGDDLSMEVDVVYGNKESTMTQYFYDSSSEDYQIVTSGRTYYDDDCAYVKTYAFNNLAGAENRVEYKYDLQWREIIVKSYIDDVQYKEVVSEHGVKESVIRTYSVGYSGGKAFESMKKYIYY